MSSTISKFFLGKNLMKTVVTQVGQNRSKYMTESCGSDGPVKKVNKAKKGKTPRGKFDDSYDDAAPSYVEKEPLKKHPNNINPLTGEKGGPAGPEPTRLIRI